MWHKVTKERSSVNTIPRYSSIVTFGLRQLTSLYSKCPIWGCRVDKFILLSANHKSHSFWMSSSEGSAASFRHTGFTGLAPPIPGIPNALQRDFPTSCNPSVGSQRWWTGNSTACNHVPTQSFPPRALSALLELLALMLGTRPQYQVGSWWWILLWNPKLPSEVNSLLPVFCNTKNPCTSILIACLLPRHEKAEEAGAFVLGRGFNPSRQMHQHLKLPSIGFARLDDRMCSYFAGLLPCT